MRKKAEIIISFLFIVLLLTFAKCIIFHVSSLPVGATSSDWKLNFHRLPSDVNINPINTSRIMNTTSLWSPQEEQFDISSSDQSIAFYVYPTFRGIVGINARYMRCYLHLRSNSTANITTLITYYELLQNGTSLQLFNHTQTLQVSTSYSEFEINTTKPEIITLNVNSSFVAEIVFQQTNLITLTFAYSSSTYNSRIEVPGEVTRAISFYYEPEAPVAGDPVNASLTVIHALGSYDVQNVSTRVRRLNETLYEWVNLTVTSISTDDLYSIYNFSFTVWEDGKHYVDVSVYDLSGNVNNYTYSFYVGIVGYEDIPPTELPIVWTIETLLPYIVTIFIIGVVAVVIYKGLTY